MNWKKHVFHWEKWNFGPIANSKHTAELLAFGKAVNIYINYLMLAPSTHVK